jgi:hypothetical protein
MCGDAGNLAGAGTDVRQCSDALGPRKNLHRPTGQLAGPSRDSEKKRGSAPGSKKRTELGLCKDCVEHKNTFFAHLTVDLVERPPTLLLILNIAD